MSISSAKMWSAASDGIRNVGEALLRELARKKEQEQGDRQIALSEELGRGNLGLGRDRLAQEGDQFRERLGMEAAASGLERGAPTPNVFGGQGIGMAGEGPTPGGALLGMLSGGGETPEAPAPAGPSSWRYNPEADPRAILQGRELDFRGRESAADRTHSRGIAELQEGGATTRTRESIQGQREIAEIGYNRGQAQQGAQSRAAIILENHGGDLNAALKALESDTSYEAYQVREALKGLAGQRSQRNILGIGAGRSNDLLSGDDPLSQRLRELVQKRGLR